MQCFRPAPLCLQWEKGVMIGFFIISSARLFIASWNISQVREEWKTRKHLSRLILLKLTLISSGCSRYWEIMFLLQSALWSRCRHPQIAHHLSSALHSRWSTLLYSWPLDSLYMASCHARLLILWGSLWGSIVKEFWSKSFKTAADKFSSSCPPLSSPLFPSPPISTFDIWEAHLNLYLWKWCKLSKYTALFCSHKKFQILTLYISYACISS